MSGRLFRKKTRGKSNSSQRGDPTSEKREEHGLKRRKSKETTINTTTVSAVAIAATADTPRGLRKIAMRREGTQFVEHPFIVTCEKNKFLTIQVERHIFDRMRNTQVRLNGGIDDSDNDSIKSRIYPTLFHLVGLENRPTKKQRLPMISITYPFVCFGDVIKVCSLGPFVFVLTSEKAFFVINFAIRNYTLVIGSPPVDPSTTVYDVTSGNKLVAFAHTPSPISMVLPILYRIHLEVNIRDFCVSKDSIVMCFCTGGVSRFAHDVRTSTAIHKRNPINQLCGFESEICSVYSKTGSDFVVGVDIYGVLWLWNDNKAGTIYKIYGIFDKVISVIPIMNQFVILDDSGRVYSVDPSAILFTAPQYYDVYPVTAQMIDYRDRLSCEITEIRKWECDIIANDRRGNSLAFRFYNELGHWIKIGIGRHHGNKYQEYTKTTRDIEECLSFPTVDDKNKVGTVYL